MVRTSLLRAAVSVAVAATALVTLQSPAAADTRGPFYYEGDGSAKCIDNPNGQMADNVVMTIYTCTPNAYNQQWYEIDKDGGYVEIRNRKSGKCLTVKDASLFDNAMIIQYRCEGNGPNGHWDQRFMFEDPDTGEDFYQLVNRYSGKCLTVQNLDTHNGAKLLQYSCYPPQTNNRWTWRYTPYGPS